MKYFNKHITKLTNTEATQLIKEIYESSIFSNVDDVDENHVNALINMLKAFESKHYNLSTLEFKYLADLEIELEYEYNDDAYSYFEYLLSKYNIATFEGFDDMQVNAILLAINEKHDVDLFMNLVGDYYEIEREEAEKASNLLMLEYGDNGLIDINTALAYIREDITDDIREDLEEANKKYSTMINEYINDKYNEGASRFE